MAIPPKSYYIPGAGKGKGKGKVNKAPKMESDNDGDEMPVTKSQAKGMSRFIQAKPDKAAKKYIDKMAVKAMAKKAAPKKAKKKK